MRSVSKPEEPNLIYEAHHGPHIHMLIKFGDQKTQLPNTSHKVVSFPDKFYHLMFFLLTNITVTQNEE